MRSKCAIGNTSNDEISLLTFRANGNYHIQNAQNQLFGNCKCSFFLEWQSNSDN